MDDYKEYISRIKNTGSNADFDRLLSNIKNRPVKERRPVNMTLAAAMASILLIVSVGLVNSFWSGAGPEQDLMSYVFNGTSSSGTVTDYIFSQ